MHSETASNGAIHSIRRSLYKELHPADDHDISFPYHVVQQGYAGRLRARRARGVENMTTDIERRVRAQGPLPRALLAGDLHAARCGGCGAFPPVYAMAIVSHRFLRYLTGLLHIVLLAVSVPLAARGRRLRGAAAAPSWPGWGWRGLSFVARRAHPRHQRAPVLHGRSPGRRSSRSSATCGAACPRPGTRRPAPARPDEPLYERYGKRRPRPGATVVAMPVAAPLLAGIAAAVAATQGRPVLFRQRGSGGTAGVRRSSSSAR